MKDEEPVATSPLSWRDVYGAVKESEQRIIDKIETTVGPLRDGIGDHEQRIRALEQGKTPWQTETTAAHARHGERIGTVEREVAKFKDRESGILSTLSVGQKLIATVAIVVGIVLTALNIAAAVAR